jgi:anti-sigma B factor antagonist
MDPVFEVELVRGDGVARVVLRGELDIAASDQVQAAISGAIDSPEVEIDLSGATFIDSTLISALLVGHRAAEAAHVPFRVLPGPSSVMRTLTIAGVDHLFFRQQPSP